MSGKDFVRFAAHFFVRDSQEAQDETASLRHALQELNLQVLLHPGARSEVASATNGKGPEGSDVHAAREVHVQGGQSVPRTRLLLPSHNQLSRHRVPSDRTAGGRF